MLIASRALPVAASAADPVIAAAGDISCNSTTVQTDRCPQKATSDLIFNAGLSVITTYSYQVRALDLAGNISDPSNSATATTPAAPQPPMVQTIAPEADARVQQSSVTTNYGTSHGRR
jgi:chitodextrinase